MSVLGIGIIGFTNFIVSFTLSLMLALRSRGIPFSALTSILNAVFKYFFKHPASFFFPTTSKVELENLENQTTEDTNLLKNKV
jgi:site-specific recombinase